MLFKTINIFLFSAIIIASFSCAQNKKIRSNNDNAYEHQIVSPHSLNLSNFVQKVELNKLCDPVKLLMIFTIDREGFTSDPEFKPLILRTKDCTPDSLYLESLKILFEKEVPQWDITLKDTIEKARISIPVRFQ